MGTLYWVSEEERYQMGSAGNFIFFVSFSSVVLAKSPVFNLTIDDVPAIETIENEKAYCNLIAPCPTTFSSLCLCCKFKLFLSKCRSECEHSNICDCKRTGRYVSGSSSGLQSQQTFLQFT